MMERGRSRISLDPEYRNPNQDLRPGDLSAGNPLLVPESLLRQLE